MRLKHVMAMFHECQQTIDLKIVIPLFHCVGLM